MYGDLTKESALSRYLIIPSEDKRVKKYFFSINPCKKALEPKELKLRPLV